MESKSVLLRWWLPQAQKGRFWSVRSLCRSGAAPLHEIMRSAAVDEAPKNLHSQYAAPHNAQLRRISVFAVHRKKPKLRLACPRTPQLSAMMSVFRVAVPMTSRRE